ncbi:RDD family protein [Microbacterium sp. MEC084]|uniref:RDD family protein n=1 Tax=unclassified Microbacterium TaxID=2609290 RepID=UPI0009E8DA4A|nr:MULTISPECIES: RDD family protein [unclassified Microbacterium]MCD1268974.1 RDD family protein [Microbacterium sp. MEC084]
MSTGGVTEPAAARHPHRSSRAVVVAHDEVLTGEAVALDVQPIGLVLRVAGAAIDVAVTVVVYVLLVLAMAGLLMAGVLPENVVQILSIVLLVLLAVVVPTAVETVTRGRSLGKLAVGGRIVRADGGAISFRHAFIRAMVGVLEVYMTLGGLALLVAIFTPRSQRLGDLVAGTYAERTRTPKLVPREMPLPPGLEGWARIADVGRLPDRLARRVAQFTAGAAAMHPAARERLARELADQVAPHVAPLPPVDPETLLRAVVAVRRERELHALRARADRVAHLSR